MRSEQQSLNSTEHPFCPVSCTENLDYILTDGKYQIHTEAASVHTVLKWANSFLFLLFNILATYLLILLSCFEQRQLQEQESNLYMKTKASNFVFRKESCAKSSISPFHLCMLFFVVELLKEVAVVGQWSWCCFRWCSTSVTIIILDKKLFKAAKLIFINTTVHLRANKKKGNFID